MKGHAGTTAAPRERLRGALGKIFAAPVSPKQARDALEGKLFGTKPESYVVGSHDFYLAYAVAHHKLLCLDTGHFHPTESVADKLSAILTNLDEVMLHVGGACAGTKRPCDDPDR